MIPYGHQCVDDDDIEAVVEVLRSDWLTQGPLVEQFEDAIAAWTGAPHAVAFANGTAALHAAAAVAGLGPGDLVATSTLTFAASANCARYVGAQPALVDIDRATLNLDPAAVPARARAIVAVHYAGLPMPLEMLRASHEVVIEDASHALGASTPDGPVGNCAHSDLCTFSFHPVKAITTGEGGAVTTRSDELAEALRRFRSHGTRPRPDLGPWAYDVKDLGFNYRLTDVQAALGLSQLRKLPVFLARRRAIAERYRSALAGTAVVLPPAPPPGTTHAYHLFPIQVPDRRRVFDGMRQAGLGVQVHYVPLHLHSAFLDEPTQFPVAEAVYAGLLSLPIFPGLTDVEQDQVIEALISLL